MNIAMSYAENQLLPGERIILKAKPAWELFLGPVVIFMMAMGLIVFSLLTESGPFGVCISQMALLVSLVAGISSAVTYFSTEICLTNMRIIAKEGLVRRRSVDLLFSQVVSIGVSQPLLGRLFNFGTITIVESGGKMEPFEAFPNPKELKEQLLKQLPQK